MEQHKPILHMFSLFYESVSPSSAPILGVAGIVWRDFCSKRGGGVVRAGTPLNRPIVFFLTCTDLLVNWLIIELHHCRISNFYEQIMGQYAYIEAPALVH